MDFEFADNKDSFKVLENPMRVAIEFKNIQKEKLYDYQVTFSIEQNDTNIKTEYNVIEE